MILKKNIFNNNNMYENYFRLQLVYGNFKKDLQLQYCSNLISSIRHIDLYDNFYSFQFHNMIL